MILTRVFRLCDCRDRCVRVACQAATACAFGPKAAHRHQRRRLQASLWTAPCGAWATVRSQCCSMTPTTMRRCRRGCATACPVGSACSGVALSRSLTLSCSARCRCCQHRHLRSPVCGAARPAAERRGAATAGARAFSGLGTKRGSRANRRAVARRCAQSVATRCCRVCSGVGRRCSHSRATRNWVRAFYLCCFCFCFCLFFFLSLSLFLCVFITNCVLKISHLLQQNKNCLRTCATARRCRPACASLCSIQCCCGQSFGAACASCRCGRIEYGSTRSRRSSARVVAPFHLG